MLATPFTVCLVVMGRHIPQLTVFCVVLGEEEALTPAEDIYHRLLKAGESDEIELAENILKTKSVTELYDSTLIAVLIAVEEDYRPGAIVNDQRTRITKAISELVENLAERHLPGLEPEDEAPAVPACRVQSIAARAERDGIAGVEEVFTHIADFTAWINRLTARLAEQGGIAAIPEDEEKRLLAPEESGLLAGDGEPVLDHITAKLARGFETPLAAITLLDRESQGFKSHAGLTEEFAAEEIGRMVDTTSPA